MTFLSERLGRDITSFDDLSPITEPASLLDERVEAIAKFVQRLDVLRKTGSHTNPLTQPRWMTLAGRANMATEYYDLSGQEIDLLMQSKCK